jgi:effector-binding domain-containing protein
MIDRKGATELVQQWLDSRNNDPLAFEKLVIDEKLTVEKELFWGIYFRAEAQSLASPGLAIVDKQTGKLYNTVGSLWYNWIREFEQYKATGHSEIDWSRSEVRERSIEKIILPERAYASVIAFVKHEEREQRLKQLLHTLTGKLDASGLRAAANPEMIQRNKDEFGSEMEVRIAYTGEARATGSLAWSKVPASNIYCTDYIGNYYDFVGALHELKRYGRVNGIKEKGEPWVEYLRYDLDRTSDTWTNRICIPIE